MTAYYNELDAFAARWLRNLAAAELIPDGTVDERSISDVMPGDLDGYDQCHFFAGIAGWSLALELAGWPPTRPVWTGSCPCQPFSAAGKRKGEEDERHLWPEFRRLIAECRPATIFGEQVASSDGRRWLAGIRTDLEELGYRFGAADLCAAGVGAPHIRQRLYWVADAEDADRGRELEAQGARSGRSGRSGFTGSSAVCGDRVEHTPRDGRIERGAEPSGRSAERDCGDGRLADPDGRNTSAERQQRGWQHGFWSQDSNVIPCTDGKRRRVPAEPAFQPLAHGVPNRVGQLRAYGNAIVPQVGARFISAVLGNAP